MRQHIARLTLAAAVAVITSGSALADVAPTRADAMAMVKVAVANMKAKGDADTYAAINDSAGRFHKGDLYLVAYDTTGTVLAHGFLKTLIGKNLAGSKDADGKPYVKERIDMAKTDKSFWQSYKYLDPATKLIRMKDSYCEVTGEVIICGGIYHQ